MTKRKDQPMTVKELAKIAACEQQASFDCRFGEKKSGAWKKAGRRGRLAHSRYECATRLGAGARDRRCYIASAVFGADAHETQALRHFRDRRLARSTAGRRFIALYYALSPVIARKLQKSPRLARIARCVLTHVIKIFRVR